MEFIGHGLNYRPTQMGGNHVTQFYTQTFSLTSTYPAQIRMDGKVTVQQTTSSDFFTNQLIALANDTQILEFQIVLGRTINTTGESILTLQGKMESSVQNTNQVIIAKSVKICHSLNSEDLFCQISNAISGMKINVITQTLNANELIIKPEGITQGTYKINLMTKN